MQIFSVAIDSLKFDDRLVPNFYYYTQVVKNQNLDRGIKYVKLGQHGTVSDGEHSAIPRNSHFGVRYLYGRNIKEGIINFDPVSDESYIDPYDYDLYTRCHIRQNDVLIAIYGTVGKSAVYRIEYVGKAGIPRHIANITLKQDSPLTPEYLTAFFRSKYGKWQIFSLMTGNIQQLLSLKNLRDFDVPVVDEKIIEEITFKEKQAVECEIKAQKLIKKAQELFYGGLKFNVTSITGDFCFSTKFSQLAESNVWSAKFYDRLYVKMAQAIAVHNGVKTLRELVTVCHGDEAGSENYKEYIERNSNDKPFIRTSDIVNYEADLYPDYYIPLPDAEEIKQDVKPGDVIFTKDGKIACVGMITESDDVILSSGIERLRLTKKACEEGFSQEYLFTALSVPEVGRYGAVRRTVVASTIPHLREDRLKDIEIPLMAQEIIDRITELVRQAFSLKSRRKKILKESEKILDTYFSV